MNTEEFNFHLKRVKTDPKSLDELYKYCLLTMRKYIAGRFGNNPNYTNVPHDVFTKCIYEQVHDKPIKYPNAWLSKIASNFIMSDLKRKDNNTLELIEDYSYYPNFDDNIEFLSPKSKTAWFTLDKESRFILFHNIFMKFNLKEIAFIMDKKCTYVRTKKFRALKSLKKRLKDDGNDKEVL